MYGNMKRPKGKAVSQREKQFPFDADKVLKIVSRQTGLKFTKGEAEKTIFVIRRW